MGRGRRCCGSRASSTGAQGWGLEGGPGSAVSAHPVLYPVAHPVSLLSLSLTHTHTSLLLLDLSWWLGRSGTQLCLAQGDKPVPVGHTTGYFAECDSLLEGLERWFFLSKPLGKIISHFSSIVSLATHLSGLGTWLNTWQSQSSDFDFRMERGCRLHSLLMLPLVNTARGRESLSRLRMTEFQHVLT